MRLTSKQLRVFRKGALALMMGGLLLPVLAKANDDGRSMVRMLDPQQVSLVVGKSTVVDTPVAIKRASLADPQVADAIVLSPKQIYVTGKGYGSTNLTLWGKDDQILAIFDVEVALDVARLTEQFTRLLPEETNLHLASSNDHLTLSGTISSPAKLSQALAVAEAYAPKKVINLLKIYPDLPAEARPGDLEQVTVEVIRGTAVNAVKF